MTTTNTAFHCLHSDAFHVAHDGSGECVAMLKVLEKY